MYNNAGLHGRLPEEWGMSGGLPVLAKLNVGGGRISGTLPAIWSEQMGALQGLILSRNIIEGRWADVAARCS